MCAPYRISGISLFSDMNRCNGSVAEPEVANRLPNSLRITYIIVYYGILV